VITSRLNAHVKNPSANRSRSRAPDQRRLLTNAAIDAIVPWMSGAIDWPSTLWLVSMCQSSVYRLSENRVLTPPSVDGPNS
jgi:hypothetical protein